MPTTIRRKLYRRGSSFETTIPMPLLFALDKDEKHDVLFKFDSGTNRWYLDFERAGESKEAIKTSKKRNQQKRGRR